mgnify:CR=1 FL=1
MSDDVWPAHTPHRENHSQLWTTVTCGTYRHRLQCRQALRKSRIQERFHSCAHGGKLARVSRKQVRVQQLRQLVAAACCKGATPRVQRNVFATHNLPSPPMHNTRARMNVSVQGAKQTNKQPTNTQTRKRQQPQQPKHPKRQGGLHQPGTTPNARGPPSRNWQLRHGSVGFAKRASLPAQPHETPWSEVPSTRRPWRRSLLGFVAAAVPRFSLPWPAHWGWCGAWCEQGRGVSQHVPGTGGLIRGTPRGAGTYILHNNARHKMVMHDSTSWGRLVLKCWVLW